jgi:2-polyprenyl-6-methoxyphenol hydroxylase-like FAD-dependent oxidoreductase
MLDRHDYWQCAFIIEKGGFDAIKARGLDAFRAKVATIAPVSAKALAEVDSWDKVKLLSVAVDHVRTWAQEGILLMGDAAHAMSPIGGVGINYAIHDAVAAANILVPALRAGDVSLPVLSRLQARREAPVRKMQRIQVLMQDKLMIPVLRRTEPLKLPFLLRLFQWFPRLRRIPARIIGIGFQPEHITLTF